MVTIFWTLRRGFLLGVDLVDEFQKIRLVKGILAFVRRNVFNLFAFKLTQILFRLSLNRRRFVRIIEILRPFEYINTRFVFTAGGGRGEAVAVSLLNKFFLFVMLESDIQQIDWLQLLHFVAAHVHILLSHRVQFFLLLFHPATLFRLLAVLRARPLVFMPHK